MEQNKPQEFDARTLAPWADPLWMYSKKYGSSQKSGLEILAGRIGRNVNDINPVKSPALFADAVLTYFSKFPEYSHQLEVLFNELGEEKCQILRERYLEKKTDSEDPSDSLYSIIHSVSFGKFYYETLLKDLEKESTEKQKDERIISKGDILPALKG